MDAEAFDEWCKRRAARVSAQAAAHINRGLPLSAPSYRTMLGEHRAYMAMRSFIHGSRLRCDPPTGDQAGREVGVTRRFATKHGARCLGATLAGYLTTNYAPAPFDLYFATLTIAAGLLTIAFFGLAIFHRAAQGIEAGTARARSRSDAPKPTSEDHNE